MSIETLKLDIINWITELQDENLLRKIYSFRKSSGEGIQSLPYTDKQTIEEGIQQLNEGQGVPYSEVRKKIKSKLNKNH